MSYIKQLSEDLVKKIAAGEVIERPASVVKELVENSIDAKATRIEIEIQRGGRYIKVSDNGTGIHSSDISLLFKRHATSKISSFDDLWNIKSLGFRGEALAAIGAVSKINCKSKCKDEENGFEIDVTASLGEKTDKKSYAMSDGTIFEVNDLFFNVPAREKFLKSETTEVNHIYDIVLGEALSHPDVAFKLLNNNNLILESSGSSNLSQTVIELVGKDLNNNLISIGAQNSFCEIDGLVSSLEIYRSNRKSMFVFIDSRPVKCQIIFKAIQNAFEGLLPPGKYPFVLLNLKFKPRFIDVNVHPSKKEVRYTNPTEVYNLVLRTLQDTISKHYKKAYEEKSIYSFNPTLSLQPQSSNIKYSQKAFDLYQQVDLRTPSTELQANKDLQLSAKSSVVFSVSNLKCSIIISDKSVANMTKAGNKTIFEVGMIFSDNVQIVFSGEIFGDSIYQKEFFNFLSELSHNIYKSYSNEKTQIQKKLLDPDLENDDSDETSRKKPPNELLYKIWERDNWTCVYCGKQLIDPKIAKTATIHAENAFVKYCNKHGKEVTSHLLKEHSASYDHLLPASKLPQFNFEPDNLYASCFQCNREKRDSLEIQSWKPKQQNNWKKPLELAGLLFKTPTTYELVQKV